MIPLPWWLMILAGIAVILCRPWIDAPRPALCVAIVPGVLLSPVVAELALAQDLEAVIRAAAALAGGGVAVAVVAAGTIPGAGPASLPWLRLAARATAAGVVVALIGGPSLWPAALMIAVAALAIDPDAARLALLRHARPSSLLRSLPAIASRGTAAALLLSAVPAALLLAREDPSASTAVAFGGLARCVLLGAGAGAITLGLLRLAQGRDLTVTLLLAMALGVWGGAGALGLPAAAAAAIAALVVSRDAARRPLVATVAAELERPLTLAAVLLASVLTPWSAESIRSPLFWGSVLALGVAAPVAFRGIGAAGRSAAALPCGGAAAVLALEATGWRTPEAASLGAGLLAGIGAGEIVWLATGAARRSRSAEAARA